MKKDSPAESYTVFARRYRPVLFDEVVGQEHVARTLRNAIQEGRVGHAYLFAGPRGVGKTSMARLLAKALNCSKGPTETPCNACEICVSVQDGTDADVIELDAASNRGVDDARTLREGVRYAPLRARFKIYILDEAHMLTPEASNTLLKTLEEPPPHVKFIFATTEIHKIKETIVSRCQRFDFRRVTSADIIKRLKQVAEQEKLSVPSDVLESVALAGRGSMRDAESLLDQLIAFKQKNLAPADVAALIGSASDPSLGELVAAVKAGACDRVLVALDSVFSGGVDAGAFVEQVIDHFRTLLVLCACGPKSAVVDLPDTMRAAAAAQAAGFTVESLLYALQILLESRRRIREGASPRIVLEVALVKIARASDLVPLGELLRGAPAAAPAPKPAPRTEPPPAPEREEPEEAPEPVGTPTGPREAQALWAKVVAEVKQASVLAGALLEKGAVTRLVGDELEFTLPPVFSKWNVEQLESAKNRAVIEGAVHKVFGRRFGVVFALDRGSGATARPEGAAPAAATGDLAADPGVQKVLKKLGGRIAGIE